MCLGTLASCWKFIYRLECTQECALRERNRRLALAFEIKNPDISPKPGPPNYMDFLKEFTKKNPSFVSGIEKALGELVLTAQKVCLLFLLLPGLEFNVPCPCT